MNNSGCSLFEEICKRYVIESKSIVRISISFDFLGSLRQNYREYILFLLIENRYQRKEISSSRVHLFKGARLMKKRIVFSALLVLCFSGMAKAQQSGFGIGVILGEPTGISFKNWASSTTAVDGGAAWSFAHHGSLHLHVDFLVHDFNLTEVEKGKLAVYYGIGGRFKSQKRERFGVRVPVGLCYIPQKAPIDLFLEIAPLLDLAPATEFGLTGGMGIRYYF